MLKCYIMTTLKLSGLCLFACFVQEQKRLIKTTGLHVHEQLVAVVS